MLDKNGRLTVSASRRLFPGTDGVTCLKLFDISSFADIFVVQLVHFFTKHE